MALLKKREGNVVFLKEISPKPKRKAQNRSPSPWWPSTQPSQPRVELCALLRASHVSQLHSPAASTSRPSASARKAKSSHQTRSPTPAAMPIPRKRPSRQSRRSRSATRRHQSADARKARSLVSRTPESADRPPRVTPR